ncbi:MAG: MarR family transcriptional regulator [Gemmatimonadetes bacterium]|nr:MarR family transcriptional regulator [Gemmatimonadota bacterium]
MSPRSAVTARAVPRASDDATRRVMDALRRIVRGLSASARVLPGGSSVSGAQLFVLRQIDAKPGLSIGELAARTLAGQSTVSEVVTRLVDRRLVARRASATDARQSELTLTASGRRAIASVEATTQERLAGALAQLRADEREILATALESWVAAAYLADEAPAMFLEDKPGDAADTRRPRSATKTTRRTTGA